MKVQRRERPGKMISKRAKGLYSRVSTWPAIQLRTDFIPNQITSNPQRENDPMATVDDVDSIIYPAFCFKASPTHFAWVKMAIADVHRLQKPREFDGKWYMNTPLLTLARLLLHLFFISFILLFNIPTIHPGYQDAPVSPNMTGSHTYNPKIQNLY